MENLNEEAKMECVEEETQPQSDIPSTEAVGEKTETQKLAEAEAKIAELTDSLLRKTADFDNYRKRMIKEKQDAFDYANTTILQDLIQVLDDFDRCIASSENATDVKSVLDGVKMVAGQLYGLLESKHHLAVYGEKGDAFDPNLHEAIGKQSSGSATEPVCSEVYLKGYKLHSRVIRAAKVMVDMPETKTNGENGEAKSAE